MTDIDLRDLVWLKGWIKFVWEHAEPGDDFFMANARAYPAGDKDSHPSLAYWRSLHGERREQINTQFAKWTDQVHDGEMKWEDVYREQ